ncbi:MAG: right-handed parallel beta-helix repeat-containing protein [Verrucomicrobiota bacterium]
MDYYRNDRITLSFVHTAVLFFFLSGSLWAGSIHVASDGNDQATGSAEAPLKTVQAGLNKAQAGDTVFVSKGIYRERLVFPRDGEAGKPIILTGENGVIIDGGTLVSGWEKVKGSGGDIYRIPYEGERPMNLTWNSKYILRIRDEFMAKGDMTTLRDGPMGWDSYEGKPYRSWDGVKAMWGCWQGYLYLGFGDSTVNPAEQEITTTPDGKRGGATVTVDGRKFITVKGLTLRNAYHAVMIYNGSSDCVIEDNDLIGGKNTVMIAGGPKGEPSRIVVTKNRCTLGYVHSLDPADARHWFIWAAFKKNSDWDRTCISMKNFGSDVEISENHLFENFNGVGNQKSGKRLTVHHNLIEYMADDGLEPDGEETEAHWHHNVVRNCNIQYRHKNIIGDGPMYVYDNWFVSRPGQKTGSNMGLYFFGGSTTPAYIYHNTFIASRGVTVGAKNIQLGLPNVWMINNVFSCDEVFQDNKRLKIYPHFDYNYCEGDLSVPKSWWGKNNKLVKRERILDLELINGKQENFVLLLNKRGVDLSKKWSSGGVVHLSLPGMQGGYYKNGKAHVGAKMQAGRGGDNR